MKGGGVKIVWYIEILTRWSLIFCTSIYDDDHKIGIMKMGGGDVSERNVVSLPNDFTNDLIKSSTFVFSLVENRLDFDQAVVLLTDKQQQR